MEILIDEAILFKTLKLTGGKRDKTVTALKQAGVSISLEELERSIEASTILNAYFGNGSPIVHKGLDPEEALLRLPDNDLPDESLVKVIEAQDDYIAARGLKGVGFSDEDIQEMESMAQFVGHGFKKTIDLTHGTMIYQMWKLNKRTDEIFSILQNTEQKERVSITDKGEVVRYVTDRYTDNEKLEWQKALNDTVNQITKMTDSANKAAALRFKAEIYARENAAKVQKKNRRLKTVS